MNSTKTEPTESSTGIRSTLRQDWYSRVDGDFDPRLSGVYVWRILGVGLYVGKARALHTRIREYPNNIRRMIDGLSWHGDPTKSYRPIHHELKRAYDVGRLVSVVVLENCESSKRAERERWWIQRRREEALVGGPRVLNSH